MDVGAGWGVILWTLGSGHELKPPGAGLHLAGHEFFLDNFGGEIFRENSGGS